MDVYTGVLSAENLPVLLDLVLKLVDGQSVAERASSSAAAGDNVFRRYSGPGGSGQS